jgi:hypothetical protein
VGGNLVATKEAKMTETKIKSKVEKATNVVKVVLEELQSRKGFDEVFSLIESDVMEELVTCLQEIVKEEL